VELGGGCCGGGWGWGVGGGGFLGVEGRGGEQEDEGEGGETHGGIRVSDVLRGRRELDGFGRDEGFWHNEEGG